MTNDLAANTFITGSSTANSLITRPLTAQMHSNDHLLTAINSPYKPQPAAATPILHSAPSTPPQPALTPSSPGTMHNTQSTIRTSSPTSSHAPAHSHQIWMKTLTHLHLPAKSPKTSIASTASDRQLQPRIPINYNERLLKYLHGKPQVKILNSISIPLPIVSESKDSTDEEAGRNTFIKNCPLQNHKVLISKKNQCKSTINQLNHRSLSGIKLTLKDHCVHNFPLGITYITRLLSMSSHNSCLT